MGADAQRAEPVHEAHGGVDVARSMAAPADADDPFALPPDKDGEAAAPPLCGKALAAKKADAATAGYLLAE